VVDVLETRLVKMWWNDGMTLLNCLEILWRGGHLILFIVIVTLTREIFGTFVFVWRAVLNKIRCQPMQLCARVCRIESTHVLIAGESLWHIRRGVLVQLLVLGKDNHGDIDGTKNSKFMRLLEEATLSL
jgi:hypothetical protein